ncbi:MAG: hypothetical protein WBH04_09590 [Albidovulum sp.]|jgi:hypothetical protein
MPLVGAIVIFAIFGLNVGLGAAGGPVFLSDVGELLTLFAAVVLFVVAILKKEAAAKN